MDGMVRKLRAANCCLLVTYVNGVSSIPPDQKRTGARTIPAPLLSPRPDNTLSPHPSSRPNQTISSISINTMASSPKSAAPVPRVDSASPGIEPAFALSPPAFHMLMLCAAIGEQDQGISFKGPSPTNADESAIAKTPDLESSEFAKPTAKDVGRDSFKKIGNRRRSSASNQPAVNLRKGSLFPGDVLIRSARILQGQRDGPQCRSVKGPLRVCIKTDSIILCSSS